MGRKAIIAIGMSENIAMLFSKDFVFSKFYTLPFSILENSGYKQQIGTYKYKEDPDDISDKFGGRDNKDSKKYKNDTDEVHGGTFMI